MSKVRSPLPFKSQHSPWDRVKELTLIRYDRLARRRAFLDPGVNYFVLMIEQLGGRTKFSCEGHPHGFYVLFEASYRVARRIARVARYLRVELWDRPGMFRLHSGTDCRPVRRGDEELKRFNLRSESEIWEKAFGPLRVRPNDRVLPERVTGVLPARVR